MSKEKVKYRQCKLEKKENNKVTEQVSYIPERYAIIGNILKLKNDDDEWVDGWEIVSAGTLTENPPDWRKMIRGHRDNTGDSEPKK